MVFLPSERTGGNIMISAGEFRKGITFEMNGEPHVILDFQHVKPGKGSPFVRTKYKDAVSV